MEKESNNGKMELFTTDSGRMEKHTDLVSLIMLMVTSMKETGRKTKQMDMVSLHTLTEDQLMKDNGRMTTSMDKE